MARPIKEGFDYIPLDVNFDKKIQALESVFKNDGFVWIIKFWQEAYQHNTGEVLLDGYHGVIHAENSRITIEKQNEILKMCLEIGLLYKTDQGKYTSTGIQKRIKYILKERERWRDTNKNELSTEITPEITPEIRGESKGKESKVKEIEEKEEGKGNFAEILYQQWNIFAEQSSAISKVRELTASRRAKINLRLKTTSFRNYDEIFKAIKEQPFLLGDNDRKWTINFDWLIDNDTNYIKVLERKYLNNQATPKKTKMPTKL